MAEAGVRFPPDFYWGTATSAHQVEGGNRNDWWEWEQRPGKIWGGQKSGRACDQYHRYAQDFAQLQELGFNAHRFSLEWSRIEPEEGRFSEKELLHYRDVIGSCRSHGMEPFVTLHHFTNPLWVARRGGWENPSVVDRFARYVKQAANALADRVVFWITVNEPLVFATQGSLVGTWPPGRRSLAATLRVTENMLKAHAAAYLELKGTSPRAQVGVAKHLRPFDPARPGHRGDRWLARQLDRIFNWLFLDGMESGRVGWPVSGWLRFGGRILSELKGTQDFVGVNYYSRALVRLGTDLAAAAGQVPPPGAEVNSLGWEVYPEGLLRVLRQVAVYGKPIYITENGICTEDDAQRVRFIREHLRQVGRAIGEGIPVRGYFYWSSHDNFEWAEGYRARFGLIGVDFATQERTVRDSARFLGEAARRNALL